MSKSLKNKKLVRPLSRADVKSQKLASLVQVFILFALLVYIILDTIFDWHGSLVVSLLIFGASFLVKGVLSKYILPRIFELKDGEKID